MRDYCYPVLVSGGRDYSDCNKVFSCLDAVLFLYGPVMLFHGSARGVDTFAELWAKSRQQIYVGFPAEWDRYGKRAGSMRNAEMGAMSQIKQGIVFQGGRGTLNMLSILRNMDELEVLWLPDGEFWK